MATYTDEDILRLTTTVREAAALLGRKEDVTRGLIHWKELPAIFHGGRYRIPRRAVELS